jgi:hypothetical protein
MAKEEIIGVWVNREDRGEVGGERGGGKEGGGNKVDQEAKE